jgi:hypothetical protein
VAEQLPAAERESLRQHLRANLDHSSVLEAVQRSLGGGNESVRVAAVKFLADLELNRKDGDECPRCAAIAAEGPAAREKVNEMIARLVEHTVRAEVVGDGERTEQLASDEAGPCRGQEGPRGSRGRTRGPVEAAFGRIIDSLASGWTPGDVSAEEAERVLRGLEEVGLLVPRSPR